MNLERYPVVADSNYLMYKFLSRGPNGSIAKIVFYREVDDHVFNLEFGDWDVGKQEVDDKARSNNNDRNKVIATVAGTVIEFIKYYPRATVFAKGSTPARTRLYQIGIFANWPEISQRFVIQGFINGEWQVFQQGINYQAFLLKVKGKF